jgi:hypothetical protein
MRLDTHGGSLRAYARPQESAGEPTTRVNAGEPTTGVQVVLDQEESAGLRTAAGQEGSAAVGSLTTSGRGGAGWSSRSCARDRLNGECES